MPEPLAAREIRAKIAELRCQLDALPRGPEHVDARRHLEYLSDVAWAQLRAELCEASARRHADKRAERNLERAAEDKLRGEAIARALFVDVGPGGS